EDQLEIAEPGEDHQERLWGGERVTMRVLRDASLKKKLMVIIMATSSVALLVACAAFVIYERAQYRKEVVDDLTVKAEVIGSQSTAALKFRDPKAATEILDKLKTER